MPCKIDRPAVVFALCSQGNDYYSAITRIAVAALRRSNPFVHLILACDQYTDESLRRSKDLLPSEMDECVLLETPDGSASFRSRYLKTSLRSIIDGPFLFLDSDVFVRKSLSPIFEIKADLAMARNHSRPNFAEQVWDSDAETVKAMGWQISSRIYFNSGVIYWDDTEKARQCSAEWHQRWLRAYSTCGKHQDQPAFNSTVQALQPRVSVLADRYNAQFKVNPAAAWNAAIWHYYCSVREAPNTRFELLVRDLLEGAKLDRREIVAMQKSRHPWRRNSIIDDWAASRVCSCNGFAGWAGAWFRGEMKEYLQGCLRDKTSQSKRISILNKRKIGE